MEEKKVEERKQKVKAWLLAKQNIYLLLVIILATIIRLYYFIQTKDQAHWWDTLAYGSLAKESIMHMWTGTHFIVSESIIRAPLLPFLWSTLIRLHFNEIAVLVFLEYIPSILSVFIVYLIGKKMYDEKIG